MCTSGWRMKEKIDVRTSHAYFAVLIFTYRSVKPIQ
jgi:hypothetical protein